MKKTIERPCFSNGTEYMWWDERNCETCVKASRMKKDGTNTKCRCAVQNDILKQFFGNGSEEIALRSYEATRKADCPYRQEHHKPRKRKAKPTGELNIFGDDDFTKLD